MSVSPRGQEQCACGAVGSSVEPRGTGNALGLAAALFRLGNDRKAAFGKPVNSSAFVFDLSAVL